MTRREEGRTLELDVRREWRELGDAEGPVVRDVRVRQRTRLGEARQIQRRDDWRLRVSIIREAREDGKKLTIQNHDFVRGIDVEAMVKRECHLVVVERRVRGRVVGLDGRVCQTRDHLLDPANSLYPSDRRAKCRSVPKLEVESNGICVMGARRWPKERKRTRNQIHPILPL